MPTGLGGYMRGDDGRRLDGYKVADEKRVHQRFARRNSGVLVTSRNFVGPARLSDAVEESTSTPIYEVLVDCTDLVFEFGNWWDEFYGDSIYNPTPDTPLNDLTIQAAIQKYPSGEIIPLFFSNGEWSATIKPGGLVATLAHSAVYRAGEAFVLRVYVNTGSATGVFPAVRQTAWSSYGEGRRDGGNYADSGTVNSSFSFAYAPFRVTGIPLNNVYPMQVGFFGDSIADGSGDYQRAQNRGFIVRALETAALPFIGHASGGRLGYDFVTPKYHHLTARMFSGITHGIWEFGANDFLTKTLTEMKTSTISGVQMFSERGARMAATTLVPRTTSSDSWATVANQTPLATESVRTGYNDWLRDGAPVDEDTLVPVATGTSGALRAGDDGHPLVAYIEVADTVESARNSGKWKALGTSGRDASYTADGVHPTPGDYPSPASHPAGPEGHAAMAIPVAAWLAAEHADWTE